jgi:septum formation protein
MKLSRELVLASASPRRREILQKLGLVFEVAPADVDETPRGDEDPIAYVTRLAEEKARVAASRLGSRRVAVLGSDTTVVLDGRVLGKPGDEAESETMLRSLSGREHVVHTAVSVVLEPESTASTLSVSTKVLFRVLSEATLAGYVASREGMDKAGSYGIQELGAALVREVHGSYSNVVGLPAAETVELLQELGVLEVWP